MGGEPTCSAWEADILPMNYIRIITIEHMCRPIRYILYYTIPQLINQVFFIVRLKFFCTVVNDRLHFSQKNMMKTTLSKTLDVWRSRRRRETPKVGAGYITPR